MLMHLYSRPFTSIAVLALSAFALLGAGCGGGGKSAPSKAEFIKQADAMCNGMDKAIYGKLQDLERSYPNGRPNEVLLEKFLLAVILPAIQEEAGELRALSAPKGDEKTVQGIASGIEAGIKKAEEDPASTVTDLRGPFSHAIGLATEYGFKVCNEPT